LFRDAFFTRKRTQNENIALNDAIHTDGVFPDLCRGGGRIRCTQKLPPAKAYVVLPSFRQLRSESANYHVRF
jgi:hypothetical protein